MVLSFHKTHRHLTVAILITLLHFTVSSIYGNYIAEKVGAEMGEATAQGLMKAYASSDSSFDSAVDISDGMRKQKEVIFEQYKTHFLILSLPSGPLLNPFWQSLRNNWIYEPLLSTEISKDQSMFRAKITDILANMVNSTSFGLLLYMLFKVWSWSRKKQNLK